MKKYRTCWISDIHLGTRDSKAAELLHFIKENEFDTIYLVGDIIDIWALKRNIYWPQLHNDVIQKLLRKGRKGSKLIYIPGNHDEFLEGYCEDFGSILIRKNAIHETADGKRILVMHGHELDAVVQNIKWLAVLGDVGYKILLEVNRWFNWFRRILGMRPWSLSAYIKNKVKNVVNFIGNFEKAIVKYAEDSHVEGVLCGHIHKPAIRKIENITYYNSGDWVESCSALVEHEDGQIELLEQLFLYPEGQKAQYDGGEANLAEAVS